MLAPLSLKERVDRFYGVSSPAPDQASAETEMQDISAELRDAEAGAEVGGSAAEEGSEPETASQPKEADSDSDTENATEPSDMRRCVRQRDWVYFRCGERCCCCCPSALPSVAYTQLEPPATKCLQCLCCGTSPSFDGADTWTGAVNRLAGVIYAGGLAVLLDCWLTYQPEALDVLMVTTAHLALVLLNSIDPGVMVANSSSIRRKAALVLSFCYMLMFAALARSFWLDPDTAENAVPHAIYMFANGTRFEAPPTLPGASTNTTSAPTNSSVVVAAQLVSADISPCRGRQAVHCIVLILVATVLRFAGHLLGTLWSGSSYAEQIRVGAGKGSPPPWVSVVMAVVAAMSLVGGITAHCAAMFGRTGGDSNNAALYVPPVYILPLPLLLIIRLKVRGGRSEPGIVWRTWHAFVPTVIYCMCVLWPLVLYSNQMLTKRQAWFSLVGACGVVLAGRIGMATLDQVTQASGSGWSAGGW